MRKAIRSAPFFGVVFPCRHPSRDPRNALARPYFRAGRAQPRGILIAVRRTQCEIDTGNVSNLTRLHKHCDRASAVLQAFQGIHAGRSSMSGPNPIQSSKSYTRKFRQGRAPPVLTAYKRPSERSRASACSMICGTVLSLRPLSRSSLPAASSVCDLLLFF